MLAVFSVNVHRAWSKLIGPYDASNHVLYSILAKTCITLFGLTEFTLRIPSLLGGLLYLVVVFHLSRRLLGEGWLRLLAVALLCLNPHLTDFMSAARGYGLALAVAANLTLLMPAAGLAAIFLLVLLLDKALGGI